MITRILLLVALMGLMTGCGYFRSARVEADDLISGPANAEATPFNGGT
jgi:hypothetical protein